MSDENAPPKVASQTSNFLNSGKHGEAPSMFSSNFRFMYRAAT